MSGVSVVVTTRNEAANLPHLLDSLAHQKHLKEIILVDAESEDHTVAIAKAYDLPIRVLVEKCSRGAGRNIGAAEATGDLLAFIDGDCIANAYWVERLYNAWEKHPRRVVAGRTVMIGFWAFTNLHRVELPHQGQDTTWPSCNLAYPRKLFHELGGFDAEFVTAEDIDLNYRAIDLGAHIKHEPGAVVYARARNSITGYLRQAYWNGYGRKQLTVKHGGLWHQYSFADMIRNQGRTFWGSVRMAWGAMGYLAAKRRKGRAP